MTHTPTITSLKGSSYWNARFQEQGFAYGEEPNDFLLSCAPHLTRGKALSLGEGEGRNAVYLAKMGFEVTAVDFSEVGLQKAQALAHHHGVQIQCICADLKDFDMSRESWHLVVSVFSQPESVVRQRLYGQLAQSLHLGGAFVLESKVGADTSGKERYPGLDVLRQEIGPLHVIHAREEERVLSEGPYHQGPQQTAQIWAQRN